MKQVFVFICIAFLLSSCYNQELEKFPLLNIVTSKGNTVYGIVNSIELEKVKMFNPQNQALKKLMSYKNDKDAYLLISYTLY